ncbi:MAG: hypothetical protein COT16_00130 [Elusimicrobia bacterium CG08_land_8_20_14_0_20_44_26]|nr:MAG: hypothetical protein COT16_00130 [Elusimicrobia bacterium CG08_land_8_20_14_0_20_44_26]
MIEVDVLRVFFDFVSASAIVILVNKEQDKVLPVWIGVFEAQAIQAALDGEAFDRPLTHDLLKNIVDSTGGKVKYVLITDVINNTFYSRIYIERFGDVIDVDARPSDAICLAIKSGGKIYVSKDIYDKFEKREDFERKLKEDFYNLFLSNINKDDLKKA